MRRIADDHLGFVLDGRVIVVPFDARTNTVPAGATSRDTGIRATAFDTFPDGSLVYTNAERTLDAAPRRSLAWVDRGGKETAVPGEARSWQYPHISPDGRRVAVAATGDRGDIWIMDAATSAMSRLTFDPAADAAPVWTPDGRRIVFASNRETGVFNLWWQAADGTGVAERLTSSPMTQFPTTVTPDGRYAIFWANTGTATGRDLLMVTLDESRRVTPLLQATDVDEQFAAVSPEGQWLAFESNSSGQREVYVRPFPDVDRGLWQVSSTGGRQPSWSRDGKELFFFNGDGALSRAQVSVQAGAFRASSPERLLEPRYYGVQPLSLVARTYDSAPRGDRFIVVKPGPTAADTNATDLILVQHWAVALRRASATP
jgi:serine/threonine-protein kinase